VDTARLACWSPELPGPSDSSLWGASGHMVTLNFEDNINVVLEALYFSYYCDMCDPVKRAKVKLLNNAASNICEAKGGDSFTTSATICPPPDANFANYCDHFSKGLGDPYWQKQGNLDVTFEVFNRKSDEDFSNTKKDPKQYTALVADYKKAVSWNCFR